MIREARPEDLLPVLKIARESFLHDDRFGAAWLVRMLARPGCRLLVEGPGGLVRAFMLVEAYQSGTVVRLVATSSLFRRQGAARALLDSLDGPASAWVREENAASRALFGSHAGWEQTDAILNERKKPEHYTGRWVHFLRRE